MVGLHPDRLADLLAPSLTGGPAYAGVARGIRGLALDGRLPVGTRLPSERVLAVALGVSRTTATAAYDVLRDEGYLRSDRGAGSRVTVPAAVPTRPDSLPGERDAVLDLSVAALPAPSQLIEAVQRASVALRPLLAGHGLHPLGLPALRKAVADHLSARGLPTLPDQVLVTGGALHGWNLVLRTLAAPGGRVLVEQPTYPGVLDALRAHRQRAAALPVGAQGWDPGPQGAQGAPLVHLTPDGQNPTGLLATAAQRRGILMHLRGSRVVVDETFADLVLDGDAPAPMAALDGAVITLGSMSKAFWAGLRIGWIRAEPELVARLAQGRASHDLASPVLDQLVAVELLQCAAEVLDERRTQLRRSRDALLAVIGRELPTWRCSPPQAGIVLWVELPTPCATRLAAHALDLGLRIVPGPRFTVDGTADRFLRLPFTMPPASMQQVGSLLAEAVSRLPGDQQPAGKARARATWTA